MKVDLCRSIYISLQKLRRRTNALEALPWDETVKSAIREVLNPDYMSSEETDSGDEGAGENSMRVRRVRPLKAESQQLRNYKTALDSMNLTLVRKRGFVARATVNRPDRSTSKRKVPTEPAWAYYELDSDRDDASD
jgi:hypothetical protein